MWLKGSIGPQVLSQALPLVSCDSGHREIFIIKLFFFSFFKV